MRNIDELAEKLNRKEKQIERYFFNNNKKKHDPFPLLVSEHIYENVTT